MCRLFGLYANRGINVQFSFYEAEKSLKNSQDIILMDGVLHGLIMAGIYTKNMSLSICQRMLKSLLKMFMEL